MGKVLGLGGVFFKAADPKALIQWYNDNLGMEMDEYGAQLPVSRLPAGSYCVLSPFSDTTEYFKPSQREFMINLIVDDVAACLTQVGSAGAQVMPEQEKSEFGTFGWFIDPAGNKIELWQPPVNA